MTTVEVNGTKQLRNEALAAEKSCKEAILKIETKTTDINANTENVEIETLLPDLVLDKAENEKKNDTNNTETNETISEESKDANIQENIEEVDNFDLSTAPTTHKKEHATQDTLEFVYHHSSSTSPSQNVSNFPVSPTGVAPPNLRPLVTHRRPSGVPPPPRELKPGDYLYQRNLNNKFELSEGPEEEEKNT